MSGSFWVTRHWRDLRSKSFKRAQVNESALTNTIENGLASLSLDWLILFCYDIFYIIEYRTQKGGCNMPVKTESADVVKAKKKLGKLIAKCRGDNMSQRRLAAEVGLPPSNMKYIEDGVNCPTAEVYSRLISVLNPSKKKRIELDQAYMIIRNTPPPDVCNRVKKDPHLMNLIRAMDDAPLTEAQAKQIMTLLGSFAIENTKGEYSNG